MNLQKILKGVSRSFYLSLVLLPKPVRAPIGLAFLACKAADTIADTWLIPKPERLKLLDAYREMFVTQANGFVEDIAMSISHPPPYPLPSREGEGGREKKASNAERTLIENLPALMEGLSALPAQDWGLIQELVLELTQGMQIDLKTFPGESEKELRALQTMEELERYIYYVAGCVGRFWTKMLKAHFVFAKNFGADVENCGEKLGKGLQLVNVLRDLPRDLRRGRCYIPIDILTAHHLTPHDLLKSDNLAKARPLLLKLSEQTKNYLESYKTYCDFHPWYASRLKGVVRLPARLGFQTLKLLENSENWLNPSAAHKVSRGQVYQTLLQGFFT